MQELDNQEVNKFALLVDPFAFLHEQEAAVRRHAEFIQWLAKAKFSPGLGKSYQFCKGPAPWSDPEVDDPQSNADALAKPWHVLWQPDHRETIRKSKENYWRMFGYVWATVIVNL